MHGKSLRAGTGVGLRVPDHNCSRRRAIWVIRASLPALKEWAPAVAALEHGDQTVLLRKGGVREPTFKPAAPAFVLFPTAFHTDAQLLKPAAQRKYAAECEHDPKAGDVLRLGCWAEVTGAWTTTDPEVVQKLQPTHIYADAFLEKRLRWRPAEPITILELRAYRLAEALVVPNKDEYWGCFSWVQLEAELPSGAEKLPALSNAAFGAEQQELRSCLEALVDLRHLAVA